MIFRLMPTYRAWGIKPYPDLLHTCRPNYRSVCRIPFNLAKRQTCAEYGLTPSPRTGSLARPMGTRVGGLFDDPDGHSLEVMAWSYNLGRSVVADLRRHSVDEKNTPARSMTWA